MNSPLLCGLFDQNHIIGSARHEDGVVFERERAGDEIIPLLPVQWHKKRDTSVGVGNGFQTVQSDDHPVGIGLGAGMIQPETHVAIIVFVAADVQRHLGSHGNSKNSIHKSRTRYLKYNFLIQIFMWYVTKYNMII